MMAEEKGSVPSEEKEVEELARAMCPYSKDSLCRECSDACFYKDYAKRAIDKGWRKQSENTVMLPCKVGDTVYVVSQGAGFSVVWNVYKATAIAIHLDRWGQLFIHVETDKENIGGYVEIERVFLTKEEAEQALKGYVK